MALLEENEAVKHQSKQSSQIDDILKSVNTLESKKLDLARKCIKDVPRELTRLHKLEFLYLEGNSLTCLPEDFFICLLNLKWLDLRNNQITHLPTTIGESRCLRSLLLENNRITRLPLELGFVQSLSGLHLADNPLEFPSKSIVEQGTQDILAFLRFEWTKLQNDNDVPLSCGESHELEEEKLTYDEGKERAQSFTRDEFSDLKLPPINTNVSANHVDATAPESKKPAGLKPGLRMRRISGQDHLVERRCSDPSRPSSQWFDDERGPLSIASSVITNPPTTAKKPKSYSAGKVRGNRGNSNAAVMDGKSADLVISRRPKEMLTHNMKRMSTGLLRKQSVESKMVEEMRQAEEKINNAKIYAILQQRKNKQELEEWRREARKIQRQKILAAAKQGVEHVPTAPPFGTHDQKFSAITKHGNQVQSALDNMDPASLVKMTRDREILDRINDHMKKLHRKRPTLEKISPSEEVEAARKNLEEALKLQGELEERKALEYRLRAFTAEDFAPPSHANRKK